MHYKQKDHQQTNSAPTIKNFSKEWMQDLMGSDDENDVIDFDQKFFEPVNYDELKGVLSSDNQGADQSMNINLLEEQEQYPISNQEKDVQRNMNKNLGSSAEKASNTLTNALIVHTRKTLKPMIDIIQMDDDIDIELSNDFYKTIRNKTGLKGEEKVVTPSKGGQGFLFGKDSKYAQRVISKQKENSNMKLFDSQDNLEKQLKIDLLESIQESSRKIRVEIEEQVRIKVNNLRRQTRQLIEDQGSDDMDLFDLLHNDVNTKKSVENLHLFDE